MIIKNYCLQFDLVNKQIMQILVLIINETIKGSMESQVNFFVDPFVEK
jgi:hypothetical protein